MNYQIENPLSVDAQVFTHDAGFKSWCEFSFARKMVEIFGEAARLTKFVDKGFDAEDIEFQWDSFGRLCAMTFADVNTADGEKVELYYSFLDLQDYAFSDAPLYQKRSQVMQWFEQWMNDEHLRMAGVK